MGEEAKQEEVKAEIKPEEKKDEKVEEKAEEPKPPSPLVLFVDLHCVGCAKKIERSILKFRGVEEVIIDMGQNQVTIKGVVDPQALCTRIQKKTNRRANILSPSPAPEGEPEPQVVTKQASGLTSVELNVKMHCEACAQQLKRKILKMRGVQTVETNLSTGKVTITGTMVDASRLVDYVYRRTKKQAQIIPQPEPEPKPEPDSKSKSENPEENKEEGEKSVEQDAKPEEKKEEEKPPEPEKKDDNNGENNENNDKKDEQASKNEGEEINEEMMKRMMYHYQPLYVIEHIPPPQIFSDENPNACCIS